IAIHGDGFVGDAVGRRQQRDLHGWRGRGDGQDRIALDAKLEFAGKRDLVVVSQLDWTLRRQCPVVVAGAGTAAEIHQIEFATLLKDAGMLDGQSGVRGGPE
ncbi:hypothetical protein RZS08_55165, partial [Arthrospira platensis SPKY1]|nr:hypothetical protein [Arthrospira platensis SPKY1]